MRNRFISQNFKLIVLLCSLLSSCIIFSQTNESFKTLNKCLLDKNEKVFVQLDKECYISGETLNFSSLILNASKLNTDGVSEEVYFEMVDNSNKPVMDWHCNAKNGFSAGTVTIPDSISFGIYTFKAFTNWMRNFSPDLYFSKKVIITRLNDKTLGFIPYSVAENQEQLISFFPEGGTLIEGIESRIAYKVNKMDSLLINKICYIKDNEGNTAFQFNVSENGVGSFNFTPVSGKSYNAEIDSAANKKSELPKASPNGYWLKVFRSGNSVRINIVNKDAYQDNEKLKLIGTTRGKISYDTILSSKAKNIQIELPLNSLREGITEFLLIRGNFIINQRLFYIEPSGTQSVNINLPKTMFNSGEKADIGIDLNEVDESSVTVSVSEVPHFNGFSFNRSLLRYMYFDSELTGIPNAIAIKSNLDENDANLVLLSTKFGQYAWNTYQNSECLNLKETSGNILKGKVKKHSSGEPVVGSLITMSCIDSVSTLKYCNTDINGTFLFLLDDYYDNKDIVFQIHGYPRTQNDIEWEFEDKDGRAGSSTMSTFAFTNSELNYISLCKNIGLVDKIFKVKQKKSANKDFTLAGSKGNFYGKPDDIVHPADFTELIDFDDVAANIVPGIRFRSKGEKSSMQVYSLLKHEIIPEEAFVILNGIPYDDLGYIATLGTKLIKKIEVSQSTILYGDITCPGIVSIYTNNFKIPANYYNSSKCIYKNEIKSIPFSNSLPNDNLKDSPDLKQTLYWFPGTILNKTQKIQFATSDLKGKYEVSVKGVTKSGKLIEKTAIIEVK